MEVFRLEEDGILIIPYHKVLSIAQWNYDYI